MGNLYHLIEYFSLQDPEEIEKEIKEELPVNTSKVRPKQEKPFSLKTISTSDPAEALVKNSQVIFLYLTNKILMT